MFPLSLLQQEEKKEEERKRDKIWELLEREREREREMGRGKIEIKRIENTSNRQVTYSKRRNGLIKKAKEISVLCDAQVSVVIFAGSGKMHEYCSPSTTLVDILDKYHKNAGGKKLWDAKHENLSNEIDRIKKENDSMQIELRHLRGEDITSLHHKELMALEEALENGLASIREKEMEVFKMMKKNEKMLEEDNERLKYILHQQGIDMEGGEMENGYHHHQHVREYQPQMPFAFHNLQIQPIQPNLQERF